MKKWLKKHLKNEKGLTLVELLAVIVILGIIAAIAVPSIGSIIQNSRESAFIADAQNALSAADLYFIENPVTDDGKGTVDLTVLKEKGFFKDEGSLKTITVEYSEDGVNIITEATGMAGKKSVSIANETKKTLAEKGRNAITEK